MAANPTFAATDGEVAERYSKPYQSCTNRAEGSYTRITACLSAEQDVQERRLNRTYVAVIRRLLPVRKDILRQDERKWIVAREKDCALPVGSTGNSDLVDSMDCRLEETIHRIIWLERY